MRAIAILATFNEQRFIEGCLRHLISQGIDVWLCDNGSTDETVRLAMRFAGRGLVGIETIPRDGLFRWRGILERKEELARALDADWFLHVDADEIRLAPRPGQTLLEALGEAEADGYNAVNFQEFTFIPTRERPDHDGPAYERTMDRYYPFLPTHPHRLTAWKKQPDRVELAWSGGHRVRFPGLRMHPVSFPMRHYLYLSISHAARKFGCRHYDPAEVHAGWHGWRAHVRAEHIDLPPEEALRRYVDDSRLDASNPRTVHWLAERWANAVPGQFA